MFQSVCGSELKCVLGVEWKKADTKEYCCDGESTVKKIGKRKYENL